MLFHFALQNCFKWSISFKSRLRLLNGVMGVETDTVVMNGEVTPNDSLQDNQQTGMGNGSVKCPDIIPTTEEMFAAGKL